jgi:hypothetical protein
VSDGGGGGGERWAIGRVRGRFFDESSRHLDQFGPLLYLTMAMVAAMSLIDLGPASDDAGQAIASTLVSLVIGITLLLALRAAGLANRWRRVVDWFVVVASLMSIVLLVVDLSSDVDLSAFESDRPSPIWVAVAVVTPIAVIGRLVRHRRVLPGTLRGAIAAYLLIAVAFTYLFSFIDETQSEPFFASIDDPSTTSYMYFSLSTITTVGYGDLAAQTNLGRLMATTEAVLGQVYLVTFVAMLVGLLIQQREASGT